MSVHFHLMTQRQNRIEFFGNDDNLIAPSALGIDEDLLSDLGGVHWSQAFVPYLGLTEEQAQSSEGLLWSSTEPNADFKMAFMAGTITVAMQNADLCANYYAGRAHFAKMLCLLHAAQMYKATHPHRVFSISWF